jgi:hypothetical protein
MITLVNLSRTVSTAIPAHGFWLNFAHPRFRPAGLHCVQREIQLAHRRVSILTFAVPREPYEHI